MSEVQSVNVTSNGDVSFTTNNGTIAIPELKSLGMSPTKPQWHTYPEPVVTLIGTTENTTLANVFQGLKYFPAPTKTETVIQNNQISTVPGMGSVNHLINESEKIIINVTKPGHLLYPGIVVRNVFEENGNIYVKTYGVGNGVGGDLNNRLSDTVWPATDGNIKIITNLYGKKPIPDVLPKTVDDFYKSMTIDGLTKEGVKSPLSFNTIENPDGSTTYVDKNTGVRVTDYVEQGDGGDVYKRVIEYADGTRETVYAKGYTDQGNDNFEYVIQKNGQTTYYDFTENGSAYGSFLNEVVAHGLELSDVIQGYGIDANGNVKKHTYAKQSSLEGMSQNGELAYDGSQTSRTIAGEVYKLFAEGAELLIDGATYTAEAISEAYEIAAGAAERFTRDNGRYLTDQIVGPAAQNDNRLTRSTKLQPKMNLLIA